MKHLILSLCIVLSSITSIQAQNSTNNLNVAVKNNAKPDIYVDGKKFDFPMELIDKDKIESVSIMKDKELLKKYNAKNGVILISTKKDNNSKTNFTYKLNKSKKPIVIINGKKSTQMELQKLDPNDIESINVLKGEQGKLLYNSPSGAIIVKLKK